MPSKALQKALTTPFEAITSDYCLAELKQVFIKKFPHKEDSLNAFLASLIFSIQIERTKANAYEIESIIRDEKDRPVLRAAIESDADLLLTGDKDFLEAKIDHPKAISAIDFCAI